MLCLQVTASLEMMPSKRIRKHLCFREYLCVCMYVNTYVHVFF